MRITTTLYGYWTSSAAHDHDNRMYAPNLEPQSWSDRYLAVDTNIAAHTLEDSYTDNFPLTTLPAADLAAPSTAAHETLRTETQALTRPHNPALRPAFNVQVSVTPCQHARAKRSPRTRIHGHSERVSADKKDKWRHVARIAGCSSSSRVMGHEP